MSKTVRLLIALGLFLLAQFFSVGNAMAVLSELAADEEVDDISLEDVVTVDPFVSSNQAPEFRVSAFVKACSLPIADWCALPVVRPGCGRSEARLAHGLHPTDVGTVLPDLKLWLRNQVFLM